jgi:quercetin dioxygenase-like cupin family protein
MKRTLATVGFGILTFPLIALQGVTKGGQQAQPSSTASHEHLVATCAEVPPGEKRPEFGCFIIATVKGLQFTQPTAYWHLRTFPSRAAAEAAKSATGIVVEEDGRVWLSEFGPRDSTLRGGEPVAVIGPLELPRAKTYDAVLSYAVMRPGDRSLVHTHPGPEGWYMLAGEECLETHAGTKKAATGQSMTVQPNVPMELSIIGTTIRRSLVLIIHDSTQAAIIPSDWKPSGACNAGAKTTIASELDSQLTELESAFVSLAEAMPEDKYSFAPSTGEFKGVRTFAQEVKHVAFANHVFFGAIVGEKAESGPGREGPESIRTKAEILGYLRESFALGHRAIGTITPDNAVAVMKNAPVPRFKTRLAMATHACAHAYDHYGQLVEYLRTNGIVPPASRPQPSPTASETSERSGAPQPLILQEDDGERRVGRPPETDFHFTIKVDGQNGNAQDSTVATTILAPGDSIPFHMHHNAEEVVILEEGGATVTVGNKRGVAGARSIAFIPRDTWVSIVNSSTHPVHIFGMFTRQGFESYLRAISVREGETGTAINPAEREQLRSMGHATYWDTSKGPTPPVSETAQNPAAPQPLILQESDGERRVGRPVASSASLGQFSGRTKPFSFTIKVDGQNGNAKDFLVMTNMLDPGDVIPFHQHHNAEEVIILEEGGATVIVGDKRAVAGPHSIMFIPRDTWISLANTSGHSIHMYGLFSRQGFERYERAASVLEGQPAAPLGAEELARLRATGHATFWDTSKGPYPPGVARP